MEIIEIPQHELMNYLPYYLIEEALEIAPSELIKYNSSRKEPRRESRMNSYLMKKNSKVLSGNNLQSLGEMCNFEQEVSKEIKKIMHKPSLFGALKNDLVFEQLESQIKNLFGDEDKENQNPCKPKGKMIF